MRMNLNKEFDRERKQNIKKLGKDTGLRQIALEFIQKSSFSKYSYNFSWLGRPIIQFPQDIVVMQELIWTIRPDLIIETGIAHGGSLIFYASILEMIGSTGEVVGIDIDIRAHNRIEIEKHSQFSRIKMIEGSSVDPAVVDKVFALAKRKERVLVCLDSMHTHEHVLRELELYSPLVGLGSYIVVFDTIIEDLPEELFIDRPWSKSNNPKTAVREFLKSNDRFVVDRNISNKLLITVAPDGYLKCIKD